VLAGEPAESSNYVWFRPAEIIFSALINELVKSNLYTCVGSLPEFDKPKCA